jgi:hypothetical protein
MTKKKKNKSQPPRPKRNPAANRPRPKPIVWHGTRYFVTRAREYPLLGSWIMEGWQETGLTPVVIARQQAPDKVIFANYLVDFYCLGVKDALCKADYPLQRFDKDLAQLCSGMPEACDMGLAHQLVYGAVEFARRFGIEPHPDYQLASMVLDPPEAHPSRHKLKFGKDGKPFFIAGPHDNAKAILAKLERTAGEGNFDYLIPLDSLE